MADRRYYDYPSGGRTSTGFLNPARASLPIMGYPDAGAPSYHDDIHVYPVASSGRAGPRSNYYPWHGVPYPSARDDPLGQISRPPVSDRGRGRDRSSTIDSAGSRPIIITTTTPGSRPLASSSSGRSGSPVRKDYRANDNLLYSPNSHARTRSANRNGGHSPALSPDDFGSHDREADALQASGRSDAYRSSRPTVTYPSSPRHNQTIDLGDDNYGYTNPGALARYDIDHSRAQPLHRRRESMDLYHRPSVYYNPDRRGLSITAGQTSDANRSYDHRGGPPPTTWGLERIRGYEVAPPPPAPAPPQIEPIARERRNSSGRHSRPVSLYQDFRPREQTYDVGGAEFGAMDNVETRGFGIRTDLAAEADRPEGRERPSRSDHTESSHRRSDESIDRTGERDVDHGRTEHRRGRYKARADERERRGSTGEDEDGGSRVRDSLKARFGAAAAAVGLAPSLRDKDKETEKEKGKDKDKDREDDETKDHYHRDLDDRRDAAVEIISSRPDRHRPQKDYHASMERRHDRSETRDGWEKRDHRREAESRLLGDPGPSSKASRDASSSDDEWKERPSKRRSSRGFNPNDAQDLKELRQELHDLKVTDKGKERDTLLPPEGDRKSSRDPSKERTSSRRDASLGRSPGRELALPAQDERHVRLVSPARDKSEAKPLRGILKQPTAAFPEHPNPSREGVLLHKDDKRLRDVPSDARWTKISRKVVNPEALKEGNERFEERDGVVVVLRVMTKDEIQSYAQATATIRGGLQLFFSSSFSLALFFSFPVSSQSVIPHAQLGAFPPRVISR